MCRSSLVRGLFIGLAAVLASGCAYKEPARGAPAAELAMRFNLDDVIPGHNRFQDFGAFLDPGCEKGNGILGGSALGPHPREATRRIEAGKRMYVRTAWINHADSGYNQVAVTRCVNVVSFVPEPGKRYELDQLIMPDNRLGAVAGVACAAELVDSETGKAPVTLQEHSSIGRCSYIYL